jgi:hypothetical protein
VGGVLGVHVQTCTLLDNGPIGVVLQVEQVSQVLGHLYRTGAKVWAGEVTHGLVALLPLGLMLVQNWKERDQRVGGGGEAALTHQSGSHVRHLLDGVVDLAPNDGSLPQRHGAEGYLHPDLTHIQAMSLKGTTTVEGDRPVFAESDECILELSWEPRAVLAHGLKTPVLVEGIVG